jgi:hypothetical protein
MKTLLVLAFAATLPLAAFAQNDARKPESGAPAAGGAAPGTPAASPQYGQGGSPHCDRLSGAERDQCLKDEGAKTDSKGPSDSAASGASAAPADKAPAAPKKKSSSY